MFPALASAVEELSVPVDTRAVTALLGIADRLMAKVAVAVGEIDRAGVWEVDGSTSLRSWLRDAGLARNEVSRLVSISARLRQLPVMAAAWERGDLSSGQVEAIVRNVPARLADQFSDHEAEVVPTLVGLSVRDTATAMQHWAAHADALVDELEPLERESEFHLSQTIDGQWFADGTFDAEGGALVSKAIELAQSNDFSVPLAQRRAEALVDVAAFFLSNQDKHASGRHRPHVNVIVEASVIHDRPHGQLVDHQLTLDADATSRLLCDCTIHRTVVTRNEEGRTNIVDLSAPTRVIPSGMWSALVLRDRRCRFPGCDRPPSWTEGHHVQWVSEGGPTRMDNSCCCAEDITTTCTSAIPA